jgi:hypothetical protein
MAWTTILSRLGKGLVGMQGSIQHVKTLFTELRAYGTLIAAHVHSVAVNNYTTDAITITDENVTGTHNPAFVVVDGVLEDYATDVITVGNTPGDALRADIGIAEDNYTVDDYTTDVITLADAAGDALFIDPTIAEDNYTVTNYLQETVAIAMAAAGAHNRLYVAAAPIPGDALPADTFTTINAAGGDALNVEYTLEGRYLRLTGNLAGAADAFIPLAGGDALLIHYAAVPGGVAVNGNGAALEAILPTLQNGYLITAQGRLIEVEYHAAPGGAALTVDNPVTRSAVNGAFNGIHTSEDDAFFDGALRRTFGTDAVHGELTADCQDTAASVYIESVATTDELRVIHQPAGGVGAMVLMRHADNYICCISPTLHDVFVQTSTGKLLRVLHDAAAVEGADYTAVYVDDGGGILTCAHAAYDWITEATLYGISPRANITQAQAGGGDGIAIGVLNGILTGAADDEIDIGGGVFVPLKYRAAPTGYAVFMNATLDGLECNNTATGTALYFKDSLGRLYRVGHNAAPGAVPFTAEAAGPPTTFQATGGATVTSEAAQHGLAPKSVLSLAQNGGGDGSVLCILNGNLTGTADLQVDIGGGVRVPVKHRAVPTGLAIMVKAGKLVVNNTLTGTSIFFKDSLGKLYEIEHDGAPGAVAFTLAVGGATFETTVATTVTSETDYHSLGRGRRMVGNPLACFGKINAICATAAVDYQLTSAGGAKSTVQQTVSPKGVQLYILDATGVVCAALPLAVNCYIPLSDGKVLKVAHDAAAGGAGYTAVYANDAGAALRLSANITTGDVTWTSETAQHALAPKAALTSSLTHPAIP